MEPARKASIWLFNGLFCRSSLSMIVWRLQLIQYEGKLFSAHAFLIREIQAIMKGGWEMKLKKVNRNCNRISHTLANKARCESLVCEDGLAE
uniref:RNase H type-1 domain-containing protein n=1 Tax=Oryza meridionalis TaxID=40149 RepID=A0A0E0E4C8_9ORYZ